MPGIDSRAAAGGAAVVYRLWQVTGAVERLLSHEAALAADTTTYDTRVANALVESTLIDLRALIGFLLAESTVRYGSVKPKSSDVRPSWFNPALRNRWSPPASTAKALRYFFDAVSSSVAHASIRIKRRPPGDWPEREALLVVATELDSLHEALGAPGAHLLRMRLPRSAPQRWRTLVDAVADVHALRLRTYSPSAQDRTVATARRRLREVLDW